MKRKSAGALIAVAVLIILAAIATVWLHYGSKPKQQAGTFSYFSVNSKTFNITGNEVNQQEWEKGLMNATVTNSTFMLFVFGNYGIYSFWMYDTYYNLDIIWLNVSNGTGKVIYIAANVPGCFVESNCTIYDPGAYANYVLEAKGGFASENNITVGSALRFGN